MNSTRKSIYELFYGKGYESIVFNSIILVFNAFLLLFSIISSIDPYSTTVITLEIFLASIFIVEYFVRFWVSTRKLRFWIRPVNLIDVIVIVSLLTPLFIVNLAFLRLVRSLQLLHRYRLSQSLGYHIHSKFIIKNKEVIIAALNLMVFIFLMTSLVLTFQKGINPGIETYLDAMYFTVAALTTTGFGDIVPIGSVGRLLSIFIMIFGITLFVQLVQTMFRKRKVNYECNNCGLPRHEVDAVHCRRCGTIIKHQQDGIIEVKTYEGENQ